ncbi:MAG: twin-arginine translocation signal domain-containing protein, partial [Actinobacteria bacterium]|nr:twin-arginine translocation signal domain-containing protein [Actinomycetota bacterium]
MATDPITPKPESELGGSAETMTGTTRRRFLQGAGVTAGALALGGITGAGRAYAAP